MALRIKSDVDLKELEIYGFKYNDYSGQYKICERNIDGATYIYINVWNRKILFRQDKPLDKECLNALYDLIKADLIEKVDE
ncbi:MAG: hypothetical protein MSA56_05390 [Clostridium sp.]|nr:hypothetical protein [Clostridium sp.]